MSILIISNLTTGVRILLGNSCTYASAGRYAAFILIHVKQNKPMILYTFAWTHVEVHYTRGNSTMPTETIVENQAYFQDYCVSPTLLVSCIIKYRIAQTSPYRKIIYTTENTRINGEKIRFRNPKSRNLLRNDADIAELKQTLRTHKKATCCIRTMWHQHLLSHIHTFIKQCIQDPQNIPFQHFC